MIRGLIGLGNKRPGWFQNLGWFQHPVLVACCLSQAFLCFVPHWSTLCLGKKRVICPERARSLNRGRFRRNQIGNNFLLHLIVVFKKTFQPGRPNKFNSPFRKNLLKFFRGVLAGLLPDCTGEDPTSKSMIWLGRQGYAAHRASDWPSGLFGSLSSRTMFGWTLSREGGDRVGFNWPFQLRGSVRRLLTTFCGKKIFNVHLFLFDHLGGP